MKLWNHQQQAVEKARGKECLALFFDPGLGKTLTTITILRELYNSQKRVINTLILAPVIVLDNWRREWEMWSKVPNNNIVVLMGPTKKRIQKLREQPNGMIAITNYEGLVASKEFLKELLDRQFEILVMDEGHKIKSGKSKRTKAVLELSQRAGKKYLLTGTPILNSPMDIFTQYKALDGGKTFGKSFTVFRATYFYDRNAGMPGDKYFPDWRMRPGVEKDLNEKIYGKAVRAIKSECLDLPPLVKKTIHCELSPDQKRIYQDMKDDFIAYLNDSAVVAELAITKALRLQQILTGVLKFDTGEEKVFHDIPRLKVLKELLEEIAPFHKVIVWCVFRGNYEQIARICRECNIGYVEGHGAIGNGDKIINVDKFNNDDNCRVFIGHPGSLGIGINLISASYSIYYSRGFSLEHDIQSEARNYRGGSERHESITRIDLVTPETIDEAVLEALYKKAKISETILEAKWV